MEPIEHLLLDKDGHVDKIFIAAKINTIIDRVNDLQQIVYDFTGHIKP